jgi:excisionase family DNA binding protein
MEIRLPGETHIKMCYSNEIKRYVPKERWFAAMASENEKWSSLEEIAEHMQVHKDTVRVWIRKGEIPAHKIGNYGASNYRK